MVAVIGGGFGYALAYLVKVLYKHIVNILKHFLV